MSSNRSLVVSNRNSVSEKTRSTLQTQAAGIYIDPPLLYLLISPLLDSQLYAFQLWSYFLLALGDVLKGKVTLKQLNRDCHWTSRELVLRMLDVLAKTDGFHPYDPSLRPDLLTHVVSFKALE